MRTIQLKSSDNQIIEVSEAVAKQSEVIKNFLEESTSDSDETVTVIPVPNVRGEILKKVIEWIIKKHSDEEEIGDWEKRFVDLDLEVMYELIMAANYLEVNALLHRCCQKIADMIAGKSPEKIREIFGIENDFTPEEEAELRSQNAWVFESSQTETETNTGSGSGSGSGSATNQ